jgi:hypothetical protein
MKKEDDNDHNDARDARDVLSSSSPHSRAHLHVVEPDIAGVGLPKRAPRSGAGVDPAAGQGAVPTSTAAALPAAETEEAPIESSAQDAALDAAFNAIDPAYGRLEGKGEDKNHKEHKEPKEAGAKAIGTEAEEESSSSSSSSTETTSPTNIKKPASAKIRSPAPPSVPAPASAGAETIALRDSARDLLREAAVAVDALDADARWTARAATQLERYDSKIHALDNVLAAGSKPPRLGGTNMDKDVVSVSDGGSRAGSVGVASEVKLGVEAVRQWEEVVARNLTVLQRRTEDALDAMQALQAVTAELERHAQKRASAADTTNDISASATSSPSPLGALVGVLGARQRTLRASLVKQAELNAHASRQLVSLRASILRVMSTIIDIDDEAERRSSAAGGSDIAFQVALKHAAHAKEHNDQDENELSVAAELAKSEAEAEGRAETVSVKGEKITGTASGGGGHATGSPEFSKKHPVNIVESAATDAADVDDVGVDADESSSSSSARSHSRPTTKQTRRASQTHGSNGEKDPGVGEGETASRPAWRGTTAGATSLLAPATSKEHKATAGKVQKNSSRHVSKGGDLIRKGGKELEGPFAEAVNDEVAAEIEVTLATVDERNDVEGAEGAEGAEGTEGEQVFPAGKTEPAVDDKVATAIAENPTETLTENPTRAVAAAVEVSAVETTAGAATTAATAAPAEPVTGSQPERAQGVGRNQVRRQTDSGDSLAGSEIATATSDVEAEAAFGPLAPPVATLGATAGDSEAAASPITGTGGASVASFEADASSLSAKPQALDQAVMESVFQLPALGAAQLGAAAHLGPWAGRRGFGGRGGARFGQNGGGNGVGYLGNGGNGDGGRGGSYYDAPYGNSGGGGGGSRAGADGMGGGAGGWDSGADVDYADLGFRRSNAATRESMAWADNMAAKVETAEAGAAAAEEAGRAAAEAAADAAAAVTAKAAKAVKAAEKARSKAEKASTVARAERDAAVAAAATAKGDSKASRAAATAAQSLLRNESSRAMDEIQAARDAISAESARGTAAEARARAAERAIPGQVAALAKRKVAAAATKADDKVRRARASAAAVRGEIEREVGAELEQAQAQIDAARSKTSEAEAARDTAQSRLQAPSLNPEP